VRRWGNPAVCAWAGNIAPAVAAQFSFVSLFNDQSSAYALALLDWGNFTNPTGTPAVFGIAQGKLGSNPVQGSPVVTNGTTTPGQVLTGSVVAFPTLGIFPSLTGSNGLWGHDFPMSVLLPGWAITAYSNIVDTVFGISFFWEVVLPIDIINPRIGIRGEEH
jgi:hypothetical protein